MNNLPDLTRKEDDSLKNQLETSSNWQKLTELQKKIIYMHFLHPEFTKHELAKEVGCSVTFVYNVFAMPVYHFITLEMDRMELKELRQLGIKALRECLQSDKDLVKLNAAITLLESEGLLIKNPIQEKDTEFTVRWADGNKDSILPPPQTNRGS